MIGVRKAISVAPSVPSFISIPLRKSLLIVAAIFEKSLIKRRYILQRPGKIQSSVLVAGCLASRSAASLVESIKNLPDLMICPSYLTLSEPNVYFLNLKDTLAYCNNCRIL